MRVLPSTLKRDAPIEPIDAGRGRVLAVDADPHVRARLGAILEGAGFGVTIAETGEGVVAAVETARFDVVILDEALPDMKALDLMFYLRHRCPETAIVVTGDQRGARHAALALRRGASRYTDKRVSAGDLVALLADVTRGRWRAAAPPRPQDDERPRASRNRGGGRPWGVVLAGGDGARLRELTRRIHGAPRPRQYARLTGGGSMLRQTLDRISLEIPEDRILVASLRAHVGYLEEEVGGSALRFLLQPGDRGTMAGTLLPVYWIRRRDPEATLAIFPADHFVPDARRFMDRVAEAVDFVERYPRWIVTLGAEATAPDTGYGWIVPGTVLGCTVTGPVWRVAHFVEAPAAAVARQCLAGGGLWDTGVCVAKASTLIDTARRFVPHLHARFVQLAPMIGTPVETRALRRAYGVMPRLPFARALLEPALAILAVLRLGGVPWYDVGTPVRLRRALRRAGIEPPWPGPSRPPAPIAPGRDPNRRHRRVDGFARDAEPAGRAHVSSAAMMEAGEVPAAGRT